MAEPDLDLVLAEHHHLNRLFSRLDRALADAGTPREELAKLLDELQTHVFQHFAHEENNGFFEQIAEHDPRLEQDAMELKQQHAALAESLQAISTAIHGESFAAQQMQDIAEGLRDFIAEFEAHEDGENRLLQETYDRDVGSKD